VVHIKAIEKDGFGRLQVARALAPSVIYTIKASFSIYLICTGAHWNPATCGTHQGN